MNERILLDGEEITNEAFARNWDDIRPYLLMVDAELVANGEEALTFFEALTVLAFATFADAPVDVMVIEVGMGGEWDSTNVADGQVAVFTPIALDHTARLGRTVAEIARTKSGIIKPAATVVSAIQTIEALDELRAAAQHNEAQLAIERVDFALESTTVAVGGQLIDLRGRAGEYSGIFLPLYGDHQAQNAAVAVAAVESFLGDGTLPLDPDLVAEGLGAVTSPGSPAAGRHRADGARRRGPQPARRRRARRGAHRVLRLRRVRGRARRAGRQGRPRHRGRARPAHDALLRDAVRVGALGARRTCSPRSSPSRSVPTPCS